MSTGDRRWGKPPGLIRFLVGWGCSFGLAVLLSVGIPVEFDEIWSQALWGGGKVGIAVFASFGIFADWHGATDRERRWVKPLGRTIATAILIAAGISALVG